MQLPHRLLHVLWFLSFMLMRLYTYSLSKQLSNPWWQWCSLLQAASFRRITHPAVLKTLFGKGLRNMKTSSSYYLQIPSISASVGCVWLTDPNSIEALPCSQVQFNSVKSYVYSTKSQPQLPQGVSYCKEPTILIISTCNSTNWC